MRVAFDTNILAYAEGLGDERRCEIALDLVSQLPSHKVLLPAQTLGELSRVLSGKAGWTAVRTREAILGWSDGFQIADSTWHAFQSALDLTVDHHLPIWDALILSVVAENHCRVLFSEDFHDGFTWGGVTIVNPFKEPLSPLLGILQARN